MQRKLSAFRVPPSFRRPHNTLVLREDAPQVTSKREKLFEQSWGLPKPCLIIIAQKQLFCNSFLYSLRNVHFYFSPPTSYYKILHPFFVHIDYFHYINQPNTASEHRSPTLFSPTERQKLTELIDCFHRRTIYVNNSIV